jgi:hypothetical protein
MKQIERLKRQSREDASTIHSLRDENESLKEIIEGQDRLMAQLNAERQAKPSDFIEMRSTIDRQARRIKELEMTFIDDEKRLTMQHDLDVAQMKISELESDLAQKDRLLASQQRSSTNAQMLSNLLNKPNAHEETASERQNREETEYKLRETISALETELTLTKAELQVAKMVQTYSRPASPTRLKTVNLDNHADVNGHVAVNAVPKLPLRRDSLPLDEQEAHHE